MSCRLEHSSAPLRSPAPPAPSPANHNQRVGFECQRNRPALVTAQIHPDSKIESFGSYSLDEGLGFKRREAIGRVHGQLIRNRSKMDERQRNGHCLRKLIGDSYCRDRVVDRSEDHVYAVGTDGGCTAFDDLQTRRSHIDSQLNDLIHGDFTNAHSRSRDLRKSLIGH
jgi:hypothetical protein